MTRLVLSLGALALLSACGIKGGLDRPDPLWNSDEAIRRECARQAENNEPQDARCAEYRTGVGQPSQ